MSKRKYALDTCITIFKSFEKKQIFTLTAAVSFYAFLSLFPFFVTVIYIAARVFTKTITVTQIEEYLKLFPPTMTETVVANIDSIIKSGKTFSVISVIFLVYLAFKVFTMLEKALDIIYNTQERRVTWIATAKAFLFFMLTAFILLILFFSGNTVLFLTSKLQQIPFLDSYKLILLLQIAIETIFFSLSYKFLCHKPLSLKRAFIGGIVTTFLWEILKHIFGLYIVSIKAYSLVYGSIGSIILLQLWLYYSILIYLFGAEISEDI